MLFVGSVVSIFGVCGSTSWVGGYSTWVKSSCSLGYKCTCVWEWAGSGISQEAYAGVAFFKMLLQGLTSVQEGLNCVHNNFVNGSCEFHGQQTRMQGKLPPSLDWYVVGTTNWQVRTANGQVGGKTLCDPSLTRPLRIPSNIVTLPAPSCVPPSCLCTSRASLPTESFVICQGKDGRNLHHSTLADGAYLKGHRPTV